MSIDKHISVYLRVSSRSQDTATQRPDLERWLAAFGADTEHVWYEDRFTGRTMQRPAWSRLIAAVRAGEVQRVVVWRLDRLGRNAKGLTSLFDELPRLGVGLVSIKDGLDLETAAGRLMANVLASVAQYETEVRAERVLAGQERARRQGKTWGGSKPGRLLSLSRDQVDAIIRLHGEGEPKAKIARATGVSRPTVYRILEQHG
ncbi:recombinase family protein [Crateriforma conspicua]|uniref:recombinase family protein n=1 Tax=Crateriforma conspicua TaxID=2527996 RepID=UPI00118B5D23|nr:recombinase family protein [Crateriforma conspicua]QDV61982.1 DNA-invertase hin [Crateriforma conspicua]